MNVRTIMSSPAIVCRPSDSLNIPAQMMWQHDIGSLPVVSDEGDLAGFITDRDICMGAYTQSKSLSQMTVDSVMSHRPVACKASDSINDAERLMCTAQVHRLPVVDARKSVIGIVSVNDIVRAVEASEVRFDGLDFVRTMAAICEPRRPALRAAS